MDPMPRRDRGRLDEIERDLLDDTKPLATALRKCIALGGELRSVPLREWASQELTGYEGAGELPEYRRVEAPILLDGATPAGIVKRQRVSPSSLPDFVAEHVSETVEMRSGVGLLENLVRTAEASGEGAVKISLPMAADIARLMNQDLDGQQIMDLYWGVSTAAIQGVLDRIRTAAVEIMGELRASTPDDEHPPSPEVADQAVNVVLHGGKRHQVTVTTAKADEGATASITPAGDRPESGWTKTATVWTVIGVIVAIVAAYFAYRQWHG